MATKKVRIICPVCSKKKFVPIPKEKVEGSKSGATAIFIPTNLVCEHEFYAYLDKNFAVRDYLALDYSEGLDKDKAVINEIVKNLEDYDFSFSHITEFIKEKDLRSLIYGFYLGNPVILIEEDLKSERFKIVYGIMARLFSSFGKKTNVMKPSEYLDFEKKDEKIVNRFVVYNVKHGISAKKPFRDSKAEVFDPLMIILKKINPDNQRVQLVYAKNWIDYMKFFTKNNQVKDEGTKSKKVSKSLRKENPEYSNFFHKDLIETMRKRIKVKKLLSMLQ